MHSQAWRMLFQDWWIFMKIEDREMCEVQKILLIYLFCIDLYMHIFLSAKKSWFFAISSMHLVTPWHKDMNCLLYISYITDVWEGRVMLTILSKWGWEVFFPEKIMGRIYAKEKCLGDCQLIIQPSAVNHSLRLQPDTHLFFLLQILPPSAERNVRISVKLS